MWDSTSVKQITDDNFQTEILDNAWVSLVDFWAEWCGPCKMMLPVLEEFAKEMWDKVKVAKINVDENPNTPWQYRIMSIPTLLVIKGGEVVEQLVWVQELGVLKDVLWKHV